MTTTSITTTSSPIASPSTPAIRTPPSQPENLTPLPLSFTATSAPPQTPKRPRARSLALEALAEDIADHNAAFSRTAPAAFTVPLPSITQILAAPLSDASLVCSAYYLALLDTRVAVTFDNAPALLVGCLGAGALDAERGRAEESMGVIAAAADIASEEVGEYVEIVRMYVPKSAGVGEYRVYDELLRGMVEGLVD